MMLSFLDRSRRSAASCADLSLARSCESIAAPRVAMVAGETSGDLLAGLLLDGMRARWPRPAASGIGGPQMARRGFQAWWPQREAGGARLCRGAAALPRDRRHPQPAAGERLLQRAAAGVHRRRRARLQPRPRGRAEGARHPDGAFRLPVDLGLARRARREDPAQRRPRAVHLSLRARAAGAARHRGDLRRPSAGQRDSDGAGPGGGARARWACRRTARCWPSCRAAGRRRSTTWPAGSSRPPRWCSRARPGIQLVVPALPARRAAIEEAARAAGLASGVQIVAGQSHAVLAACDVTLIASGTATLEAALFKRPMVIAYAVNWLTYRIMRRQAAAALDRPAQHPVRRVRRAGIAAGATRIPRRSLRPCLEWLRSSCQNGGRAGEIHRAARRAAARHRDTGHRCDRKSHPDLSRVASTGTRWG